MINFFTPGAAGNLIRDYFRGRGAAIADRVRVLSYEDLGRLEQLQVGGTVFAGLDEITSAIATAIDGIHDQLAAASPVVSVLNDPRKVLCRYELLRRLYEIGCNQFRVIRAVDDPSALEYPVFIRRKDRHTGSLTPLLRNRQALDRALGELIIRRLRPADLLVVEFCDTTGPDGLFRKYSAMRIGDAIIPRHLHVSREWVTKSQNSLASESVIREEVEYLECHPHERWLSQVFEAAQIEYGRVDYGIYRGEPQVWEINMNPTLGRGAGRASRLGDQTERQLREPARARSHQRLLAAFAKLDRPAESRNLTITIGAPLRERLDSEVRARRRSVFIASVIRAAEETRAIDLLKRFLRPGAARLAPVVARLARQRGLSSN
jgi:hypothetical protein